LVETDKVTVDIKAERDGILIKQLGDVDDTVEVGAGLYILDTDVQNIESAVVETNMSEVNAALYATKAGEEIIEVAISKPTTRIPSIHFLGKDGWKARLTATDSSSVIELSYINHTNSVQTHGGASDNYRGGDGCIDFRGRFGSTGCKNINLRRWIKKRRVRRRKDYYGGSERSLVGSIEM